MGAHDIVQVSSRSEWEICQLNNSVQLVPEEALTNTDFDEVTYYYNCSEPGGVAYLTCSVPGHCESNQKVAIQTSETEYAYNRTTGNWTLHVDSLSRALRLLGYRQSEEGFIVMDRGYQTEDLADITTELIWCGLDHCPQFAYDFDPSASWENCESMIFTLLGFISRKRPIPRWNESEKYYKRAIKKGGSNTCTARSYLTQLYMTKGAWINASLAVAELCANCQNEPDLIRQAELEYQRLNVAASDFDFHQACQSSAYSLHVSHHNFIGAMLVTIVLFLFVAR